MCFPMHRRRWNKPGLPIVEATRLLGVAIAFFAGILQLMSIMGIEVVFLFATNPQQKTQTSNMMVVCDPEILPWGRLVMHAKLIYIVASKLCGK